MALWWLTTSRDLNRLADQAHCLDGVQLSSCFAREKVSFVFAPSYGGENRPFLSRPETWMQPGRKPCRCRCGSISRICKLCRFPFILFLVRISVRPIGELLYACGRVG